ncbi:MAG: NUDIX domain-containing protein [Candidatus Aenigmarchaeota archaeon]|nr:NUDIX domain-containing protein [Candidatus Aenigmarchaeota archaeon]
MTTNNISEMPRVVVGILIHNNKNEIFLARSHKWKNKWIVPGGHLEWGETLHGCAKREVKEETNLDVDNIKLIDIQESIFSEEYHEKRHMVFIDFSAKVQSNKIKLNDELQEYKWFKTQDALKIDLNPATKQFIEKFIKKKSLEDAQN